MKEITVKINNIGSGQTIEKINPKWHRKQRQNTENQRWGKKCLEKNLRAKHLTYRGTKIIITFNFSQTM